MKIAVGTDDLKTIRSGHFGESKYYKVFEVEDGKIVHTTVIENPFLNEDGAQEHHHGEAKNIMKLLRDCSVFLAKSMGMHSIPKLVQRGVKPVISQESSIEKAINDLIEGNNSVFRCFNPAKGKFETCTERLV